MTTPYLVSQLVSDTIEHLMGTTREQLNVLHAGMGASTVNAQDTVELSYGLNGAVPGATLSIEDESVSILSVNQPALSCVVLRGQHGSAPVSHGAGIIIVVDPPWPRWTVLSTLRDELRSWGPQVFRVLPIDIATATGVRGYDLGDIEPWFRVLDVISTPPPLIGDPGFVFFPDDSNTTKAWTSLPFRGLHDAPTNTFPSGNGLIIDTTTAGFVVPGQLHVLVARPFGVIDTSTETQDCIADLGLDESDLDIAPYGAAWRLLAFREVRRTFTQLQGQPRDANDVGALAIAQAAAQFKTQRDSRLGDAQIRLANRFPLRMSAF